MVSLNEFDVTYATELHVALDLDADEEHASVKEKHVALPLSWIVVSLGVDSSWHGPDSCSSHFVFFSFEVIKLLLIIQLRK